MVFIPWIAELWDMALWLTWFYPTPLKLKKIQIFVVLNTFNCHRIAKVNISMSKVGHFANIFSVSNIFQGVRV